MYIDFANIHIFYKSTAKTLALSLLVSRNKFFMPIIIERVYHNEVNPKNFGVQIII